MIHTLKDIPIEQLMVEHYLFCLGCPIETTSEICGMDEASVKKIYRDYKKYTLPTRSIK